MDSIACKKVIDKFYLLANTQIECYTEETNGIIIGLVIFCIVTIMIMVPLVLFSRLFKASRASRFNLNKKKQGKLNMSKRDYHNMLMQSGYNYNNIISYTFFDDGTESYL